MNSNIEVEIRFAEEESKKVVAAMKDAGGTDVRQPDRSGFTGIEEAVAASILISALGSLIVKLVGMWKCGIVVDATQPKILTTKDCGLSHGQVVVIGPDNVKMTIDRPQEGELTSLIQAALAKK